MLQSDENFGVGVGDLGAEVVGDAVRGLVDGLEVLGEGLGGAGDDGDFDSGLVPEGCAFVHFGDG